MGRGRGFTKVIGAAIVSGVVAGLGAIAFHFLADTFGTALFQWADARTRLGRVPAVLIVPTFGLFLVGIVLQAVPEARYGGVGEVLEALEQETFVPTIRLLNVLLSGLVLAFGGSVGPEGPMVQLGAISGNWVGKLFGLSGSDMKTLVRAGAAAGIGAAFRSPAGGVLLALEVLGARFNQGLGAIAIASSLGYITRTAFLGDAYPFQPLQTMQPVPLSGLLIVVPIMGLVAAPTGDVFIAMFERFKTLFPKQWPLSVRVGAGGLLVGIIGIWFPQVLSAGYAVIDRAIRNGMTVQLFVALLVLKMLATSLTFGSGAVGGLFAPTLVMGAMFGGAFGYGAHALAPEAVPQPQLFVLLGMIVMFGAVVKGYWSGLLMIADMSGCYHQLLLPGVIAGGICFVLSWELRDRSIFGLTIDPAGTPSSGDTAHIRVG